MPLRTGTRLGPYQVLAPIGAGGMGEVYRARDTRLDREVAIKVLPASVAQDCERLLRFEREAKVVASLNHPNIAQIYGVEEDGETRALVMELVAGSTLSVPQPLETALDYARQIADGMEAAHEKGIAHRDLKPANIMITPEGVVKILDFGLAAVPAREADSDPANSPTFTMAATQAGMIMGTAGYMSPEQAAGKAVDKRSDVWSFGVVLWEMLTGAKLFEGETLSHTLADVLRAPVEFGKLPPSVPAPVVELLRRCLDRNVKTRLQAIGEARIAIQKYQENSRNGLPAAPAPPKAFAPKTAWGLWVGAAVLVAAVAGLGYMAYRRWQEPPLKMVKASVLPPEKAVFVANSPPALSPDGRKLAFAAIQEGTTLIWIRDLDSLAARSITGSDGGTNPFWSPDSQSIGFFADSKLKRADIAGGAVRTLCDAEGNAHGASWSNRGVILFPASEVTGLSRVPATGGTPVPATTLDKPAGETSHRLPWFLPDGRHFLFTVRNRDQAGQSAVYAGDLDSNQRVTVLKGGAHAAYVAGGGFLVYTLSGLTDTPLMAQPFDLASLHTAGEAFPIAESVDRSAVVWAQHQFSVSQDGTLAYVSSGSGGPAGTAQLTWIDRGGKVMGTLGPPDAGMRSARMSPDGNTVAVERLQAGAMNIWLHDVPRGTLSRFTFGTAGALARSPAWAADGKSLLFAYAENSQPTSVMRQALASGGVAEPAGSPWGDSPRSVNVIACSPDGRYVVVALGGGGPTGADIWILPLNPPGEKPRPYLKSNAHETGPSISPSSDWLAYTSNETRRAEVYVQSFPNPGHKYQVSVNGGHVPVWSRDGRELFFIAPDRQMMAASVRKSPEGLVIGTPKALFDSKIALDDNSPSFDVAKDGRFLIPMQNQESQLPMTLVINWQAGVKK